MKKNLRNVVISILLFLMPTFLFGQTAPNLGTTSSFAFFTAAGAFNVVGATTVTGDVGTNVGAFNGFPPGVLVGDKHVVDPTSAQAAIDVGAAYGYMSTLTCGNVLGTPFGSGQTLAPGVYCAGGASTLNGDLTLNGGGDPDAKFYIKINGALATGTYANVILTNGTKWSNVYWQINGQFTLGDYSVFRGTILGAGAIILNDGSSLYGRGLTTAGAISLSAVTAILPPPLTVSTTQINVQCFGNTTGSATAIPAGGTAPYSYSWNTLPVQTTVTATGLAAGTYTVTVTDTNGTIATASVTIAQPPLLALTSAAVSSPILCNGGTAIVTIVANGGTLPYYYTFNGQTNNTGIFNGVSAGLAKPYSITDASNCGPVTGNVNVVQPPILALTSAAVSSPILCNGGTAIVTIVANGGTPPYSYTFNGQTNATGLFIGVSAGLAKPYSITDASNCGPVTGNVNVVQPPLLALTSAAISSPILCNGGTATVTIVANGGTAPYSYTFNGQTNATGIFTGVLPGFAKPYSITDANNCGPITGIIDVVQPPVLALTSAAVTTPILCNGGTASVKITADGGTAPYSYTFNGQTNSTGLFTGVLPGLAKPYSITDANTCGPITGSLTITQPLAPAPPVATTIQPTCLVSTGTITVTSPIGAGITYSIGGAYQSSTVFSLLLPNTYIVTAMSPDGCISPGTPVTIVPAPGAPLAPVATTIQPTCLVSTGTITVTSPIGAGITYSIGGAYQSSTIFSLLLPNTYTVTAKSPDGCISPGTPVTIGPAPGAPLAPVATTIQPTCLVSTGTITVTSPIGAGITYSIGGAYQSSTIFNLLLPNTYTVTAKSPDGCISPGTPVTINAEPSGIIATSTHTNVKCFGGNDGTVTITFSGGNPPFKVNFNGGGFVAQTSPKIYSGLIAGTYNWAIQDANLCEISGSEIVAQPALALTVSTTQTNVLCFGSTSGSATATPTGGTAPYTYLWNTVPAQTTATVNNLAAGTYTVKVTDSNGCITMANVNIIEPAAPITGTAKVTITLTGSGGTTPLIYTLDGMTNGTGIFTDVKPGVDYVWSITDGNNCAPVTGVIKLCETAVGLTLTTQQVNVLCFGASTGSATVTATGGSAPYTYSWNTIPVQTTATANNLGVGLYTVTVTDNNGVKASANVTITQPAAALTVSTIQTNIQCAGQATGSATALASGGSGSYTYSWNTSPVKTSITASGLVAGTYVITVTDSNGCIATSTVTIVSINPLPTAAFTSSETGLMTYSFVNTSANATTYVWDFGDSQASVLANPTHVYAAAGTYTVKLTATNSCGSDTKTQVLTIPEIEFFNGFSPNGDGQNDYWNIPILNYYPTNTVLIINRWGSELWKGINYNNKNIVWTGKNMNGEDLPDGTYYYIINYDNTEKRGWVFIKR
jgi:gliding motility-associated-like protein